MVARFVHRIKIGVFEFVNLLKCHLKGTMQCFTRETSVFK
jgi:hypothetical protein